MQFYWFLIGVLAVWRATLLLGSEAGPWDLLKRMRGSVSGTMPGNLLGCFYCLSLWVSIPFALLLGETWRSRVLLCLAFSGGAIIIERAVHHESFTSMPVYHEDEENPHVLRQEHDPEPIHRS